MSNPAPLPRLPPPPRRPNIDRCIIILILFINNCCSLLGSSCRTRVTKHLAKEFNSLSEAEECLHIDYISSSNDSVDITARINGCQTPQTSPAVDEPLSPVFASSPTIPPDNKKVPCHVGDLIKEFLACFKGPMSYRLKTQLLNYLFKLIVMEIGGIELFKFVNPDFINTSLNATKTLFDEGKHNLIFNLCQCFQRTDAGTTTRMPLDRMPYGMLDYNIRFFASSQTRKLGYEEHYASWLETMFSQFGHKWLCLHRGPVWQYQESSKLEIGEGKSLVEIALDESGIELEEQIYENDDDISQSDFQQSLTNLVCLSNDGTLENVESSLDNLTLFDYDNNEVETGYLEIELQPTSVAPALPVNEQNGTIVNENSKEFECSEVLQTLSVSNLWSQLTDDEQSEMEKGLISSKEMETYHGIQPGLQKKVKRNSGLFDPMKVCLFTLMQLDIFYNSVA
jgi:hypothetical protein